MSDAGPPPGGQVHYNPMFERFVPRDEADGDYLSGLVAYALYKSKKQEWARELTVRRRRSANAEEVADYTATWTPGQIAATRAQAEQALTEYAELIVTAARPGILRDALRGGFWKSVGASVTAAVIYSAILLVIAFGLHASGIDLLSAYEGTSSKPAATVGPPSLARQR